MKVSICNRWPTIHCLRPHELRSAALMANDHGTPAKTPQLTCSVPNLAIARAFELNPDQNTTHLLQAQIETDWAGPQTRWCGSSDGCGRTASPETFAGRCATHADAVASWTNRWRQTGERSSLMRRW